VADATRRPANGREPLPADGIALLASTPLVDFLVKRMNQHLGKTSFFGMGR
jgi:hypothetical protein